MTETNSTGSTQPDEHPQPVADDRALKPHRKAMVWWMGRLVSPILFLGVGLLLIMAVGVAQRAGWISSGGGGAPAGTETASNQVFTCPMHPQIRQPTAGRCPICDMPLVPAISSGGADLDELSVKIEPAQRRLANIQVATAKREPVFATIQTVGAIAIDESRMATISSYIEGRLERLFADYTGVDVAKNDHLAVLYSPELYAAQVEYLASRKALSKMTSGGLAIVRKTQETLVINSRQRLVELGMTEDQIVELESTEKAKSRLTIYTPIGGTVTEKLAVEGKYVKAGEPIYRIADLSTVWLMLELYPEDASRIRFGQRVEAEMQSLPGEVFSGRVAFIDRIVDPTKRTVGVRVELLNDDRRLRPGDYASATIYLPIGQQGEVYDEGLAGRWISPMHPQIIRDEPGECPICGMDLVRTSRYGYSDVPVERPVSLTVPRSALLMAGDSSVIYVETDPGRFEIRLVTLGPILRDRVVILGGIEEGEQVAVAGNFLIDSQMQLAGNPSLIDPTRAIRAPKERKSPLKFEHVHVEQVSGEAGDKLERLYAAYFAIKKSLAADRKPGEHDTSQLHELSTALAQTSELPNSARTQLETIATQSEELHLADIEQGRLELFRPISLAVVALSTQVRGSEASQPFFHMFCPMVKGGSGDWLQPNSELINPYWGSKMLHCGETAHVFPAAGHTPAESPQPARKSGE